MNKIQQFVIAVAIVVLGIFLRDGNYNIWIDETFAFRFVQTYKAEGIIEGIKIHGGQEVVPTVICLALGLETPREIRSLHYVAGILLIALVPIIKRDYREFIPLMLLFALSPILIYWCQFARPYTLASLFVLLAWRYPVFIVLAIFTNPLAMVGINIFKLKEWKWFYLFVVGSALAFFYVQPLPHGRLLNLDFLINARRIYVIPTVVIGLYIFSVPSDWLQRLQFSAKRLVKYAKA